MSRPAPTPAQLACGSATTVASALAMLLLSRPSGPAVALVALGALLLGLLVALMVPAPRRGTPDAASAAGRAAGRARTPAHAGAGVPERSLHG
ncbi:hypothetical protein GCM10010218_18260 [Streptomyces mashuensis]|uniref:Uncharacterized protein n=1 Tax=Streptomyces mashuensis TaxID=33904 RepID=A0A919B0Q9_9ACTN|nr:hypothetical protein [Streptomyces mashuensis]GHF37040.1 hypothetical protein GCM10010218_18260 [Streptomyces mashuensis]